MVRVVILGQGYVGSIFALGVERIKTGELGYYGIPLQNELPIKVEDIEIVGSYDVDKNKIGKSLYEVVKSYWDDKIPETLKSVIVRKGIHLKSLRNLPIEAEGLEDSMTLKEAVEKLVEEWKELDVDVIVNVCTTEAFVPFGNKEELVKAIENDERERLTATQVYAYAAALYAKERGGAAFVNAIPTLIANDPAFVELAKENNLVVFGDDGATGATPLTADILSHLAQRNRYVRDIAQFNIGGNTDFLALTDKERNKSKEFTKSSVVKDLLGYEAPHYIKPTGFLEPLGDKKFIAMHIEYVSFNGAVDELVITGRINDSPALAGLLVDLVRLGKIAIEKKEFGTVYEVNAFYMKNPGPQEKGNIPRIIAHEKMRMWAGLKPKWL
ncbi:MAG: myo-inositol-phosphate synthase [Thermococcaceae archaeon]|jgi:myo-inositol-1-phosphate synthase|uniref:inositol-3-phosphate synthase n=1 Tax=Thermococcus sp. PK TaxID=913025 RepID=UPI0005B253A1|nr:inositol-3-phosphate synthase [Thermococcus sp. PK]KUJ99994.1 MAG: Inositol-1-phosphate synthase [Thermococcales archaeon 44_46]MDN5320984.1 myo-inositol-phosphate synthase [Thermococcaceae archaeon]HIH72932.1 inositol-3-phosphate synthase [Thermococcaceae archaeon]